MPINLATIDLNLLVVFNAIMEERNVSQAGKRVGMSQPATSNALQRLRLAIKDPLFVRSPNGMQPTARALELASPVSEALRHIRDALEPNVFEPESTNWVFNIAMSDVVTTVVLPHLAPLLANSGANLRFIPKVNAHVQAQFDSNTIDFAIGIISTKTRRVSKVPLFQDRFVCMMREGHPLADNFSAERYLAADHIAVRTSGEAGNLFDSWILKQGLSRRVKLNVGQFLVVPDILRESDLVISLASRTAKYLIAGGGLVVRELPFDFGTFDVSLAWHTALSDLPSHRWMRKMIFKSMEQVPPMPPNWREGAPA